MVPCPHCLAPLPAAARGAVEAVHCSGCRREIALCAWPALDRPLEQAKIARPAEAGEAVCFSCQSKAATGVCSSCGSYLCPACEADWFGRSLCLNCVHALREVKGDTAFRHRATIHDNIALMMLVLPLVIIPFYGFFFALLLSPVSLFMVFRYRKASRGLPPRGPFRLIAAGTLASLLMLGFLGGVTAIIVAIAAAPSSSSMPPESELFEDEDAALEGDFMPEAGEADDESGAPEEGAAATETEEAPAQ